MINFKEEIQKYKPILEVDQVEEALYSEDAQDLLEVLKSIDKKIKR